MRLALAGDMMLGRGVAEAITQRPPQSLVGPTLAELMRAADLTLLNLECCISERGAPWRLPGKPFFFRAPPHAVDLLAHLGVDCVTLANNHALDFGPEALLDTFSHLQSAGIAWVGAGWNHHEARRPLRLAVGDQVLSIVAFADHPAEYAAGPDRPGIAYASLTSGLDAWVAEAVANASGCVLVTPHWGPNMASEPRPYVRGAARRLLEVGATVVAGHSAHVVQGVDRPVLYDLGDFLDDYRVDPDLRNDLGLLFILDLDGDEPQRLEAVPLKLDYCRTDLATGADAAWISWRFRHACATFGQDVTGGDGRLVVNWLPDPGS